MTASRPDACPCGGASPQAGAAARAPRYAACCGRFIDGGEYAPTALELMCSRYSAYVIGANDYLRATWDPGTCPGDLDVDPSAPDAPKWLGLAVKRHEPIDERRAIVEFVARYKIGGRAYRLHEVSRFTRDDDGRWRYVDGDVTER
jgi:SEC-C motif-containing protein